MVKLLELNTYNLPKPKLSDKFIQKIVNNYYDDIHNLSKLLNKNYIKLWFSNYKYL